MGVVVFDVVGVWDGSVVVVTVVAVGVEALDSEDSSTELACSI